MANKKIKKIFSKKSDFQTIEVFEVDQIGRALVLNGEFQFADVDEHIYHETITKVPFSARPKSKKILIIGGGDGGTARECLKFNPERIDVCDLDQEVTKTCDIFFPQMTESFKNPKVSLFNKDGKEFVKKLADKIYLGGESYNKKYDMIIVDSTDPLLSSKPLFDDEFYRSLKSILIEKGVIVSQIETAANKENVENIIFKTLQNHFKHVDCFAFDHLREFSKERYFNLFSIVSDEKITVEKEIKHYFKLNKNAYSDVIKILNWIKWLKAC